jgi:hypothetical protein
MQCQLNDCFPVLICTNYSSVKQLIWQAALPLLLASGATAEKDVTCTTNEVNLIQNPSFESGSLSGWKSVGDSMHLVTGHKAAHGDCHL